MKQSSSRPQPTDKQRERARTPRARRQPCDDSGAVTWLVRCTAVIAGALCLCGMQSVAAGEERAVPAGANLVQLGDKRAKVLHVPDSHALSGDALVLAAAVDDAWSESELLVRFRPADASEGEFDERAFGRSSTGIYLTSIPASSIRAPGVEYYIVGTSHDGDEVSHFASATQPHRVVVMRSLGEAYEQQNRERLGGQTHWFGIAVRGQHLDEGNGYLDTEFQLKHVLLAPIVYAVEIGFGTTRGRLKDQPWSVTHGYGGARFRLRDWLWASGRLTFGVDQERVILGGQSAFMLGRPWAGNLEIGFEYLNRSITTSLWTRLQWDTLPRLLMGMSVRRDRLGSVRQGEREKEDYTSVVYDVSFRWNERARVRAHLSLVAGGDPVHVGGGLMVSVGF